MAFKGMDVTQRSTMLQDWTFICTLGELGRFPIHIVSFKQLFRVSEESWATAIVRHLFRASDNSDDDATYYKATPPRPATAARERGPDFAAGFGRRPRRRFTTRRKLY